MNYVSSVLISNFKAGTRITGFNCWILVPGSLESLDRSLILCPTARGIGSCARSLLVCLFRSNSQFLSLHKKCPCSELFWSEYRKMPTRITPNMDTFYAVYISRVIWFMQIWIHIRKQKWQLKACAKSFRLFKERK